MKISVITPLYQGNNYIEQLFSMLEQNVLKLKSSHPKMEVEYLLVNDDPDNTISIDRETTQFTWKIINNEKNVGIHQSRVNGLNEANGEYVLFLDQDDMIENQCLLSQIEKIRKADIIVSNGYRKQKEKKEKLYRSKLALILTKSKFFYIYGTDMILSPGQCLIRKSSIPKQWYESIMKCNGSDDFYLWLLLFQNNVKIAINSDFLYTHIEEDNKNLSNNRGQMERSYEEMCYFLEVNKNVSSKELYILRKRAFFKKNWKESDNTKLQKVKQILNNIDILCIIVLYKLAGYR